MLNFSRMTDLAPATEWRALLAVPRLEGYGASDVQQPCEQLIHASAVRYELTSIVTETARDDCLSDGS
jgi:hypothetical protein